MKTGILMLLVIAIVITTRTAMGEKVAQPSLGTSSNFDPSSIKSPLTATAPVLENGFGIPLSNPKTQQQVMIAVNTTNRDSIIDFPAITIVMVQDSQGITKLLTWHTGIVAKGETVGSGMSWTPQNAGHYTITVIVVNSLSFPMLLAGPIQSNVSIQ